MLCILEHYRHITASLKGSLPKHNVLFCCCNFCGLTLFIFANSHHNLTFFPAIFIIVVLCLLLFFIFSFFIWLYVDFCLCIWFPRFSLFVFPYFPFSSLHPFSFQYCSLQFSTCFISSFRLLLYLPLFLFTSSFPRYDLLLLLLLLSFVL